MEWDDPATIIQHDHNKEEPKTHLPLEGADRPQLILYVFLAYLALQYFLWAVRAKNPSEVQSSCSQ